jgi:hypothetical protein
MEQNFQTSFIPKKPIIEDRIPEIRTSSPSVGPFTLLAIFIFFALLLSTGGLFFYKEYLIKNIQKMENNLKLAQNRFEPERISQLKSLDKRLSAANEVLSNHIAISPIFKVLQETTLKTIRYTKFSYNLSQVTTNQKVLIKMNGESFGYGINSGYRGIALQADILSKNKNIIEPVFSNLKLDEKGSVLFDLEFYVDSSFVDYKQMLQKEEANEISF